MKREEHYYSVYRANLRARGAVARVFIFLIFGIFFQHVKKLLNFQNFVKIKVAKFKLRTGYQADLKVCGTKFLGQVFFIKNQKFIMFKACEAFVWCLKDHFYAIYGHLKKKRKKSQKISKWHFWTFFDCNGFHAFRHCQY